MRYLILILIVFNYSCTKEPTVTPTIHQITNSYTMTIHTVGGIATNHNIKLNGTYINPSTAISVSTGDKLTGYSKYLGSVTTTIGIIVYLNGVESYKLQGYQDSLSYNYTVN